MAKSTKKLIITAVVAYTLAILVAIGVLLSKQDKVIFHPNHDEASYNEMIDNDEFDEIKIDKNGKTLSGWIRYNSKTEKSPLIIFFYGNAQNSSNALNRMFNGKYEYFEGYSVISIDYPQYGLSEGKLTEKELFENALLVYDYAKNLELVDENNIIIMGYSIGTGMATYLASERESKGLILIAPYDELLSLYNEYIPIFVGPLKMIAQFELESKKYAESIDVSTLIFTSYADEVINHNYSERLAEHFKNLDELVIEKDLKHNDYFYNKAVLERIQEYIRKVNQEQ